MLYVWDACNNKMPEHTFMDKYMLHCLYLYMPGCLVCQEVFIIMKQDYKENVIIIILTITINKIFTFM